MLPLSEMGKWCKEGMLGMGHVACEGMPRHPSRDYELQKWKTENEREGERSWLETTTCETAGERDSVKLVGGSSISKKYTG